MKEDDLDESLFCGRFFLYRNMVQQYKYKLKPGSRFYIWLCNLYFLNRTVLLTYIQIEKIYKRLSTGESSFGQRDGRDINSVGLFSGPVYDRVGSPLVLPLLRHGLFSFLFGWVNRDLLGP